MVNFRGYSMGSPQGFSLKGDKSLYAIDFHSKSPFRPFFFVLPFAVTLLGFLLFILVGCRSVDFRVLGYKVVFHVISPVDAINIHQPEILSRVI